VKLKKITVVNFKCFDGTHQLEFATDQQKNVTVVHGFNGAGKTVLLNALVWCLYDKTTPKFDGENLGSYSALKDKDEIEVSVRVQFEGGHDGKDYVATRRCVASAPDGVVKSGTGEFQLEVKKGGELLPAAGSNSDQHAAQKFMETILPRGLSPWFFFSGEQVEEISASGSGAWLDVEKGVCSLLKIEAFDRASRHAKKYCRKVSKEIKDLLPQSDLTQTLEALEEKEEKAEEKLSKATEDAEHYADLEQRLFAEIGAIEEFQKQHEDLQAEMAALKGNAEELEAATDELNQECAKHGFLGFADSWLEGVLGLVNEAKKSGELPAKIKPSFVDETIAGGTCICGRGIDSEAEESLERWKQGSGLAELDHQIIDLGHGLSDFRRRTEGLWDRVDDIQPRLSRLGEKKRKSEETIKSLEDQLESRSADHAQLERLQGKRKRASTDLLDALSDKKLASTELEQTRVSLEHARKAVAAQAKEQEKTARLQRQFDAFNQVARVAEGMSKELRANARQALNVSIRSVWEEVAVKDFDLDVSSAFQLDYTKKFGDDKVPANPSQGEQQIGNLAFVGSLVKRAREPLATKYLKSRQFTSSYFTLVVDSPFGALAPQYQGRIAKAIPDLVNQVVLLVSNSQWTGAVENAIGDRVGRHYIAQVQTTKPTGEGSTTQTSIGGRSYDLVRYGQEAEMSVIEEVGHE
jgi:DNA sulfur modification protein DndD